jgi:uncharacterized protein YegL
LLLDVSGSTVRDGYIDHLNQAMPLIVDEVAHRERDSRPHYLSVSTFASESQTLITLDDPTRIEHIPALRAGGLGLLSSGLTLLGVAIEQDALQAVADRMERRAAARIVILTDGMPVDSSESLIATWRQLRSRTRELLGEVVILVVNDLVRADLAALGARISYLTPVDLSASVLSSAVLECAFSANRP